MLQCPNQNCQTPNDESRRFCHRCHVPLPKRYLLGIGADSDRLSAGVVVGDRYLYKGGRIFLDLQPGIPPAAKAELLEAVRPYLRLVQYRLHLPQVYDWVDGAAGGKAGRLVLLCDAAIYCPSIYTDGPSYGGKPSAANGGKLPMFSLRKRATGADPDSSGPAPEGAQPRLLPKMADRWESASTWRRLNWLWQIAQLWQPFEQEQVVASLLSPQLLRVEGPLVRLLELQSDRAQPPRQSRPGPNVLPDLTQLGQLGQSWLVPKTPDSAFFTSLCDHLIAGKIGQPGQLIDVLESAMAQIGPSRSQSVQLTTQTDQGPSRSRNEDACFPPSSTILSYPDSDSGQTALPDDDPVDEPVVIVCDGIGGHQGGDVASQLAIHSICDHLIDSPSIGAVAALGTFQHLSDAICDANTLISQRNDGEQRRDRQRMGTTVVMALVSDYNCYISHIGDSRAYWVTRWGCHQITLDDDVASREVRLGYTTHADAVHRPGAGSLVQALGMASSTSLHPTVQRLILDGAGLLLLCSDGLSDNDLVEIFWRSVLLPVLSGELELAAARQTLVDTANAQNGYDNVTVGLVQWHVTPPAPETAAALKLNLPPARAIAPSTRLQTGQGGESAKPSQPDWAASPGWDSEATGDPTPPGPMTPTRLNVDLRRPAGIIPLLGGIVVLLGIGGLLIYMLIPSVGNRLSRRSDPSARPSSGAGGDSDGLRSAPRDHRVPLTIGVILQIGAPVSDDGRPLSAYAEPVSPEPLNPAGEPNNTETASSPSGSQLSDDAASGLSPIGYLIPGMTAQVIGRSEFSQAVWWVELRVCQPSNSLDDANTPEAIAAAPLLQPGQSAWVPEMALASASLASSTVEAEDSCASPPEDSPEDPPEDPPEDSSAAPSPGNS